MTIVQVTSTLWYQKSRKIYQCRTCGRIINKGEYYYRYKSCYKDYGWITPIETTYCKRCGEEERQKQAQIATVMNPILAVLCIIGLGLVIVAFVLFLALIFH